MNPREFIIRRATFADVDGIAQAHMASIHSIGAKFYSKDIVEEWGKPRDGSPYLRAMEQGEVLFVAIVPGSDKEERVVGFSSYRLDATGHRTAVYVDETAARRGVGTALFQAAENIARERGAREIHVDSSLAAADFYRVNGFEALSTGEHALSSGGVMGCVFMRKILTS